VEAAEEVEAVGAGEEAAAVVVVVAAAEEVGEAEAVGGVEVAAPADRVEAAVGAVGPVEAEAVAVAPAAWGAPVAPPDQAERAALAEAEEVAAPDTPAGARRRMRRTSRKVMRASTPMRMTAPAREAPAARRDADLRILLPRNGRSVSARFFLPVAHTSASFRA
jgi:hypothetical protein